MNSLDSIATHKIDAGKCPTCFRPCTAASAAHHEAPKEGDLSVCLGCGAILVFGKQLHLRKASKADLDSLRLRQPSDFKKLIFWQERIRQKMGAL